MINSSFQPIWISPPGDTIADILKDKGISSSQFANLLSFSENKVRKLIIGKIKITNSLAKMLEETLGSTATYWMNRESQYRNDLSHYKIELQERKEWMKQIPVSDMSRSGWIDDKTNKEIACLQFFGITRPSQWYEQYNDILYITSFRTSASFDSKPESVVTWLRRGEISSEHIFVDSHSWNESKFRNTIKEARELSRINDPQIFLPKLQSIFSKCGVAIVIEKAPKRCRASGAAYFVSPSKAIILLSGRYLSDDHFWFSLFHEAGHILLHGNKRLFLELDNKSKYMDQESLNEEKEADLFAEDILIPKEYKNEFMKLNVKNWKQIVRFAKKIGISAGIVVGQLQHLNRIDQRYLNRLKKKYKWDSNKLMLS